MLSRHPWLSLGFQLSSLELQASLAGPDSSQAEQFRRKMTEVRDLLDSLLWGKEPGSKVAGDFERGAGV